MFTHAQGVSLYYVWLNPDDTTSPVNSPVVLNSIYHINITGFVDLGLNGNPLYPDDPSSPNPAGPNPDPKPSGPGESGTTPMDPSYPLSPVDTYMSIEATVLPWEMYSYDINL